MENKNNEMFVTYSMTQNPADMTLRDYFAGQMLASRSDWSDKWEAIAKECYKMADAMLKERER